MRPSVVCAGLACAVALAGSVAADSGDADQFIAINGVRLHYLDWGGGGEVLLFLPSLGASVHEFDHLAPRFTDRFHVLGLTRRGQTPSDAPESGYDTRTLVEDIRGFLDAKGIEKATLVGYSVAGVEETSFAAVYPGRVARLVYLDAVSDPKSAYELATNPSSRYPMPLPEQTGPLRQIARGARQADADYTKVDVPALAFCVIYEKPYIPPDADAALKARLIERYEKYGRPFEVQQREHFRRDMKKGRIVELRGTDHAAFMHDPAQQAIVVREMKAFLSPQ